MTEIQCRVLFSLTWLSSHFLSLTFFFSSRSAYLQEIRLFACNVKRAQGGASLWLGTLYIIIQDCSRSVQSHVYLFLN